MSSAKSASADAMPADGDAGEYVVVARRYRPQSFAELVGQEHVAKALSNAIATGRVGHAYLFTGARGVGKTSAARILAKALDCVHGPTVTPCNECDVCLGVNAGADVDVIEIDGASNRGIDEIRQLRQNAGVRPSRARFKIYIIDEVHMLTAPAFNALLKTLEEPPEHVKFIFCTTEAAKIPITILSRCQRYDFAGIATPAIVDRLAQIVAAEGVSAEPAALAMLARRAGGSMRDSQSLLEQLLSFCDKSIKVEDVNTLLGTAGDDRLAKLAATLADRQASAALAELDAALAEGVDVGQLLEQLLGYFRDCMVAAVGGGPDQFLHAGSDEAAAIAAIGKQWGLETVLAAIQILDHTLGRLRSSTQGRVLAELALVRIASLENLESLSQLIAELRGENGSSASSPPAVPTRAAIGVEAAKKKAELAVGHATNESETSRSAIDAAQGSTANGARPALRLSDENVLEVWQGALALLPALLAEQLGIAERVACLANSAPNRLVVSFRPKYTSLRAFCERPEQLGKLEKALADVVGAPVKVEFSEISGGSDDEKPAPALRPQQQRQRAAEKVEHPLVKRATELFDARLVRIDEPPATPSV